MVAASAPAGIGAGIVAVGCATRAGAGATAGAGVATGAAGVAGAAVCAGAAGCAVVGTAPSPKPKLCIFWRSASRALAMASESAAGTAVNGVAGGGVLGAGALFFGAGAAGAAGAGVGVAGCDGALWTYLSRASRAFLWASLSPRTERAQNAAQRTSKHLEICMSSLIRKSKSRRNSFNSFRERSPAEEILPSRRL